jgi:hypothetical protein
VAPCCVTVDGGKSSYSYCFYSDDRGGTWMESNRFTTPTKGEKGYQLGEGMVVELKGGRLMMVCRCYQKSIYKAYSSDGGATWGEVGSSGVPSPSSMPTICRMSDGNILLIWNWAPVEAIRGSWPRNFLTAAVSTDEGQNFTYVRHLDGSADFEGKITMASVTFVGDNAVIVYSKSATKENRYDWRLQVIPVKWFYEGDTQQVYGQKYLPTLAEKLKKPGNKP